MHTYNLFLTIRLRYFRFINTDILFLILQLLTLQVEHLQVSSKEPLQVSAILTNAFIWNPQQVMANIVCLKWALERQAMIVKVHSLSLQRHKCWSTTKQPSTNHFRTFYPSKTTLMHDFQFVFHRHVTIETFFKLFEQWHH